MNLIGVHFIKVKLLGVWEDTTVVECLFSSIQHFKRLISIPNKYGAIC